MVYFYLLVRCDGAYYMALWYFSWCIMYIFPSSRHTWPILSVAYVDSVCDSLHHLC